MEPAGAASSPGPCTVGKPRHPGLLLSGRGHRWPARAWMRLGRCGRWAGHPAADGGPGSLAVALILLLLHGGAVGLNRGVPVEQPVDSAQEIAVTLTGPPHPDSQLPVPTWHRRPPPPTVTPLPFRWPLACDSAQTPAGLPCPPAQARGGLAAGAGLKLARGLGAGHQEELPGSKGSLALRR